MKNSWVLSIKNQHGTKYEHHYFCTCGNKHTISTQINEPYPPQYICQKCSNDMFINTIDFEDMAYENIFDILKWEVTKIETSSLWQIVYQYKIPQYIPSSNIIQFVNKKILSIELRKDWQHIVECKFNRQFQDQYYKNEDKKLIRLFQKEPRELLYKFVMQNKTKAIQWIDEKLLDLYSRGERLEILSFFLQYPHLKELEFFYWEFPLELIDVTKRDPTQIDMLNYITNNQKAKIIKKTLYIQYQHSIKTLKSYNPMFDYIVSRVIDNIDLLVQLYKIEPKYKSYIFDIFSESDTIISFINFLKRYYTQKQIVKFFINLTFNNNYKYWQDTINMVSRKSIFNELDKYFVKIKLSPKKLHDEIIRVSHISSYCLSNNEKFNYTQDELKKAIKYESLEFRLPKTVYQLDLWSQLLHNCMFGYSNMIHRKQTIIYGVFKNDTLLYAVEIKNNKIIQAKAIFNKDIPANDMQIIKKWEKTTIQT